MKIYSSIEQYPKNINSVLTTGTFDGVHMGHQIILNRLIQIAKKNNGESVILTFYPHPRKVLYDDHELKLITTQDEKLKLLESLGIDHVVAHPFTKDFSRLSSIEFIRDILVKELNTKKLVIGYDHHFGRNREGTFNHLKECSSLYGFDVEEIPPLEVDKVNVSSSKVRVALEDGDVKLASLFLRRNYSLEGRVVTGKKIGRTLGYPTANILVKESYKLIPKNGVYAVKVLIDNRTYKGMLNIGYKPTFHTSEFTIEVNIFSFNKEIYGELIQLEFIDRIRDEKQFNSKQQLIQQLQIDKNKVDKILH